MAGFREFVTGEVLTAANVDDFLAKQAVMKFADAAARDSALGTAVASGNALREGMVAYLDDEDAPSFYDGSAWGPISVPIAGIGSNVVQTVKTNTFSTTSVTFTDVTGLTATITPSSATSKILVMAQVMCAPSSGNNVNAAFRLNGGNASNYVGDVSGVLLRAVAGLHNDSRGTTLDYDRYQSNETIEMKFLDSPATTSPVTYAVQTAVTSGTSFVNRNAENSFVVGASSITVIEVAA
jgi:hypothetical protein